MLFTTAIDVIQHPFKKVSMMFVAKSCNLTTPTCSPDAVISATSDRRRVFNQWRRGKHFNHPPKVVQHCVCCAAQEETSHSGICHQETEEKLTNFELLITVISSGACTKTYLYAYVKAVLMVASTCTCEGSVGGVNLYM